MQGVVNATNEKFASVEQIKAFRMIPKELDHEDGELTATQKLKRGAMAEMFGDLVSRDVFDDAHGRAADRPGRASDGGRGGKRHRKVHRHDSQGLALGSIYALLAFSFVLVFKATQAVNFAQGAIALVGTWYLSLLLVDWEIPAKWLPGSLDDNEYVVWFSSLAAALVLAVIIGLVIERLLIRPMIGEPLFAIAVITLGLEAVLRTIGTDAVSINNRSLADPVGRTGRVRPRRSVHPMVVRRRDHRRHGRLPADVLVLPHPHGHRHARRGRRPGSFAGPRDQGRPGVRHRLGGWRCAWPHSARSSTR